MPEKQKKQDKSIKHFERTTAIKELRMVTCIQHSLKTKQIHTPLSEENVCILYYIYITAASTSYVVDF